MKTNQIMGVIGACLIFLTGAVSVEAANEGSPPPNIELENIFQIPTNSASSVLEINGGNVVQLTPAEQRKNGAIWSTDKNKMNLLKDFEASMYLYFGNQGTSAADGMAFVMQNDARGPGTIISGDGSQLGVWDAPKPNTWGYGIEKSFAIEFDTHYNGGNGFDSPVEDRDHIAWNFPGVRDKNATYEDHYLWPGTVSKRKLIHNGIAYPSGELSSDKWYPFNIKWSASAKTITYQFDNLAPVTAPIPNPQAIFGSDEVYWGFTGSTGDNVEMNRVAFEKVPGLVNATAKTTITNQKDESVAGKVVSRGEKLTYRIDASYISGKQDWKEVIANMELSEAVDYVEGTLYGKSTGGIEVILDDSLFNEGSLEVELGTLTTTEPLAYLYFDAVVKSNTEITEVAESSVFSGKNHIENSNKVTYQISQNQAPNLTLDNENTLQTVGTNTNYEVTGTWKDPDETVTSLRYVVNGNEIGTSQETSASANQETAYTYWIPAEFLKPGIENTLEVYAVDQEGLESQHQSLKVRVLSTPKLTLNSAGTTVNLENGLGYELTGTWQDSDSPWVHLYYVLDGAPPVQFAKEVPNSTPKDQVISYQKMIESTELTLGLHTISVYAEDSEGQQSNSETLSIDVTGNLQFTNIPTAVSYETTKIPSEPTVVSRNNDWDIRVKDTRAVGSEWHVLVTMKQAFVDQSQHQLADSLFYKTGTSKVLLKEGVAVEAFSKKTTNTQEVPVEWSEDNGLLMDIQPSAYTGDYQGILEWTLMDTP
ncbi:L-type lectin-domain containing protein [Carnobacterium gallinarum]|uniref:L-type lectin-domain containing protein n=1 Tax=Carnobacterium gallinarum TaxID=2749 RepID=UPI00054DFA13|nr:L-type lectin-domain containing protein [Carnobacterium gallinarum]